MPRNGSGTYSVPTTYVANTPILSADVNGNFTDVASALTASLALDGQSSMTGQFKAADGSITAPGIAFTSDTNTGFYRSASGVIRATLDGTNTWTVSATAVTITGDLAVSGAITQAGAALALQTITLAAGTGLTGGGTLAANRTFALADTAVTPGSYTRATITVDQQGRLTAAAAGASEIPTQSGNTGKLLTTNGTSASWGLPYFAKGEVTSGGTLSGGVNCTVASGGTGSYTVTFDSAAPDANYIVLVTSRGAAGNGVRVSAKSTTEFTYNTFNTGNGAAANLACDFIVLGAY